MGEVGQQMQGGMVPSGMLDGLQKDRIAGEDVYKRQIPRRVTSVMVRKVRRLTASCTSAREGSSRKVSINPPNTSMGARMPPRWTLSNIWWTL